MKLSATDKLSQSQNQSVESLAKLHLLLGFITSEKSFHQKAVSKVEIKSIRAAILN